MHARVCLHAAHTAVTLLSSQDRGVIQGRTPNYWVKVLLVHKTRLLRNTLVERA